LEGSVRWQKGTDGPDRVRITPQLIRVSDDTQLWSSQYDRELEDIFEIQSEIAQEIVDQLGSALSVGEGSLSISEPITENLEAYKEYLRATHLFERANTPEHWGPILAGYQRAVELDPGFIEAWTKMSMSHSRMYHNFDDRTEERLVRARETADRIFEIQPDHPLGHVALGHYYYWGRKDYARAIEEFAKTGSLLERDTDVISALGYINRRRVGKMEEALLQLKKAHFLSPRDPLLAHEIGYTLQCLRRFGEAEPMYDLAIALATEQDTYLQSKSNNKLYWTGDSQRAELVARAAPTFTDPDWNYYWSYLLAYDGKSEEALRFLTENANETLTGTTRYLPMALWRGLISWCTGNDERTREFAEEALKDIEPLITENPREERYRMAHAKALALLGRREEALQEARVAMDLIPLSKDALRAFDFKWRAAEVAAMLDEQEVALDLIEEMLTLPGGVSAIYIKNSPWFARLRGNEQFEALVGGAS
jgi:serine/threonine-protein kinase